MDVRDITARFQVITIDSGSPQAEAMSKVRSDAMDLAFLINDTSPDGREKSSAITRLEEAVFWANRAIASGRGS